MSKVKINILKKGDTVLFMNEKVIAVKRKNEEVDIFPIIFDDLGGLPRIDTDNVITIGFGKNTIETIVEGNEGEIKITTF